MDASRDCLMYYTVHRRGLNLGLLVTDVCRAVLSRSPHLCSSLLSLIIPPFCFAPSYENFLLTFSALYSVSRLRESSSGCSLLYFGPISAGWHARTQASRGLLAGCYLLRHVWLLLWLGLVQLAGALCDASTSIVFLGAFESLAVFAVLPSALVLDFGAPDLEGSPLLWLHGALSCAEDRFGHARQLVYQCIQ